MQGFPAPQFATLGSASKEQTPDNIRKAEALGRSIARSGAILMNGGCAGLPYHAAQGAKRAGGMTMAVSPALNMDRHINDYGYPRDGDIWVFTGIGRKGRNLILVRSANACIFLGGGLGTLNEFTIACDELGPDACIGLLAGTGGATDLAMKLLSDLNTNPTARLFSSSDPDRLVHQMINYISRKWEKPTI